MLARIKRTFAAGALALGIAVTPAIAQQAGLVNVSIGDITTGDILSNNRVAVGVAAQIAASVCGVTAQVGVITEQIARTGDFNCQNEQTGRFVQVTR